MIYVALLVVLVAGAGVIEGHDRAKEHREKIEQQENREEK
jgi:hypothetical protein